MQLSKQRGGTGLVANAHRQAAQDSGLAVPVVADEDNGLAQRIELNLEMAETPYIRERQALNVEWSAHCHLPARFD